MRNKIALILLGILLLPTIAYASDVFGDRVTMWLIHNYYEEECYEYEACALLDYRTPSCRSWNETLGKWVHRDAECLMYHLVRKTEKAKIMEKWGFLDGFYLDINPIFINQTE